MTALSQVLRKIDADEVVELTRSLVRIPSVYRPGDPEATEARVAAFVEAWLRREGFQVEVQQVAPGRPNVIGWLGEKRPGCRSLLLEGHTDVVTEGDPAEWSHPPFGADMVDGRIYGRGTADMKSGLAAAMVAAAAFRRAGVALRGKLVLGALVDEEDGMIGVRHLCGTAVGRELDAAIICEPEENELCLEQRGVVWARSACAVRWRRGHAPGGRESDHRAWPAAGRRPASSDGCGRPARRAAISSRDRDPDHHPGAAARRGSTAIERHPRAGRDDVRHPPHPRHRRRRDPRRAGGDLSRRGRRPARDQGRVGAGERLPPGHQGGPLRGPGGGDGPWGQAGDRRAAKYGGVPGRRTARSSGWSGHSDRHLRARDRLIPHQVDEFVRAEEVV